MAEHTPGPWWPYTNSSGSWDVLTYRDCETAETAQIGSGSGASIALGIGDHTEKRTSGNEEANARLIAAAPNMFEACVFGQKLIEAIPANERLPEQQKALNGFADAIAKARGDA